MKFSLKKSRLLSFSLINTALLFSTSAIAADLKYNFVATEQVCDQIYVSHPEKGAGMIKVKLNYTNSSGKNMSAEIITMCGGTMYPAATIKNVKSLNGYIVSVSSIYNDTNPANFTDIYTKNTNPCVDGKKDLIENARGSIRSDGTIFWQHRKDDGKFDNTLGSTNQDNYNALCR